MSTSKRKAPSPAKASPIADVAEGGPDVSEPLAADDDDDAVSSAAAAPHVVDPEPVTVVDPEPAAPEAFVPSGARLNVRAVRSGTHTVAGATYNVRPGDTLRLEEHIATQLIAAGLVTRSE